jgi:hypothetical protein
MRPAVPADPRLSQLLPEAKENELLYGGLEHSLRSRIPKLPSLRFPHSTATRIGSAYKNLCSAVQYHSTSKMKDEPIILATIMQLDVSPILEAAEKMAMFHVLMGEVPGDIIFLDLNGKTLQHEPFRWAPATLLESERRALRMDTDHPSATCDANGLHVVYGDFLFWGRARDNEGLSPLLETQYCIRDRVQGDQYLVRVKSPGVCKLPQKPAIIFRGHHDDAVIVDILDKEKVLSKKDEDKNKEIRVTIVAHATFESLLDREAVKLEKIREVEGEITRRWRKWCIT